MEYARKEVAQQYDMNGVLLREGQQTGLIENIVMIMIIYEVLSSDEDDKDEDEPSEDGYRNRRDLLSDCDDKDDAKCKKHLNGSRKGR